MDAVEIENVSFSYDNTIVLSHASLKVHLGEFIGLIGPNGGGKTTLLKLILGFLRPTHGRIRVFDKPPYRADARKHVAYVPQTARFDRQFPISVLEVVLSGLLSHLPWHGCFCSADRKAAIDMLEQMGLGKYADRSFGDLSGGQAQRVLIARALVSQPKLLLLDEPTASVDSKAEADIYSILKELKGKMTILMVTHDLNAAIDQVDRLFCVQGNVFSLKPEEVCEHFALGLYHSPLIQSFNKHPIN